MSKENYKNVTELTGFRFPSEQEQIGRYMQRKYQRSIKWSRCGILVSRYGRGLPEKKAKKRYFKMSSERVMQEICTVTALGENALTSISYAKVALQMAETQNGCRKIGLGYSGNNVQCHLWINTETYLANAEESVTKFFRYLKCCFLPEIVKVGTKSYSRKECLQAFSKDTAELSNLEILSTNISELLQILISLGG